MPDISKEKILSAKFSTDIFPMDEDSAKAKYYSLIKIYHPDVCKDKDASDVFAKLSTMYKIHTDLLGDHPGLIGNHDVQFTFVHPLGPCMIQPDRIMISLTPRTHELALAGFGMLADASKLPSDDLKKEINKYLPDKATLASNMLFTSKSSRSYPIKRVIEYFGGKIPPRHVAWIMNSIYNTLCYLHIVKNIEFNGITTTNLFIDPAQHIVIFTLGWWHASYSGEVVRCLPKENYFANKALNTDIESARLLALEMLGDRNGVRLHSDKYVPSQMLQWLMGPMSGRVLTVFNEWSDVLNECFGPRKFVEMKIDDDKIYSTKEN